MSLFGKGGSVTNFLNSDGFQGFASGMGKASEFLNGGDPLPVQQLGQSLEDLLRLIQQHRQAPQQPVGDPFRPMGQMGQGYMGPPPQINPVQPGLIQGIAQAPRLRPQQRGYFGDYPTEAYPRRYGL